MRYSPTKIYKRYFSTTDLREANISHYVICFKLIMAGCIWYNKVESFIYRGYSSNERYNTFTKKQHFATMRYIIQEHPELFI